MGDGELRAIAEAMLCETTGAQRVVRLCPECGSGAHGRPMLVGTRLRASISYAGELVAIAWGEGPVGVDVEVAASGRGPFPRHGGEVPEQVADPALPVRRIPPWRGSAPPAEVDSPRTGAGDVRNLLAWTRTEALAKAAGTGLRGWPEVMPPELPTRELALPEGYVGTLAGAAQVRLGGPAAAYV